MDPRDYYYFWFVFLHDIRLHLWDEGDAVIRARIYTLMTCLRADARNNVSQFLWWFWNEASAQERTFAIDRLIDACEMCSEEADHEHWR